MSTIKLKPDKTLLCPTFDGYKLTSASGQFTTYSKPLSDGLCCSSRSDNSSYLYTRLDALHNCLIPEIASGDDSSYSTVYCFNRRGQLLAYDYSNQSNLCPSRVVWHADLEEDAAECPSLLLPPSQPEESASLSDSASMFGWLRPTLVLASPSVAVASDGRRHVSILHTGNRNTEVHHTWTTVFTVSVGSCEVTDARVVHDGPDNALLHVLLVAVVPPPLLPVTAPPMLSSAPSLHLLTWLTISIENGKAYKVQRERLFAGTAALEYYQLDVSCSSVMLLTHKLYMQLRDSACPEVVLAKATLPSNKTDEEAKNKRLFLFQQTDDDVTIRVSTATSTSSENMLITVSRSELCVGLRVGEVLLKGTFLHAVDPNTATWTVESGRVEINVCKSITGQRWESLLQEPDLRGEEEDMFQETDPLAHLTSETWGGCNGRDEKPAFHPGELESCDDADSDLVLLVLEAEGHSSVEHTPRAFLGNTQYLATIPTECGLPSLFCVRHDVDGVVWRVGQQLPKGAEDCFTHTATFNAFGYVRAGKTMAKYTSAPPDCSFVAVCDVRSHVYLFCQPSPLGGELKNRRTGKVTSNVARQLLLSLPSHDEVMGFVAFSSVLFVCTASDVYAYALALSNA